MIKPITAIIMCTILLSGCSINPTKGYQHYLHRKGAITPTVASEQFTHCHGYGCKFTPSVSLTTPEWKIISAPFKQKNTSPEQERTNIKKSIAAFEKSVGKKMGTNGDIYGTFQKLGPKQLDCVDESTNTTTYLSLLEQAGFLKHHKTNAPTVRLPLIHGGRWPHQAATIIEKNTKQIYVVDSWFHDNGFEPEIIPIELWKTGWRPQENQQHNTVE